MCGDERVRTLTAPCCKVNILTSAMSCREELECCDIQGMAIEMTTSGHEARWDVLWRDRHGGERMLAFELGRGLRYRVVIRDAQDDERFLQAFLRPPHTALLAMDGGLLSNLKVDENVLLPLAYRGGDTRAQESRVLELFAMCGFDESQTRSLLHHLPHQLTTHQRRVASLVRALLVQPEVMVYAAVWHDVTQAERQQILALDEILHRVVPTCTSVFIDYDSGADDVLQPHQTFYLQE